MMLNHVFRRWILRPLYFCLFFLAALQVTTPLRNRLTAGLYLVLAHLGLAAGCAAHVFENILRTRIWHGDEYQSTSQFGRPFKDLERKLLLKLEEADELSTAEHAAVSLHLGYLSVGDGRIDLGLEFIEPMQSLTSQVIPEKLCADISLISLMAYDLLGLKQTTSIIHTWYIRNHEQRIPQLAILATTTLEPPSIGSLLQLARESHSALQNGADRGLLLQFRVVLLALEYEDYLRRKHLGATAPEELQHFRTSGLKRKWELLVSTESRTTPWLARSFCRLLLHVGEIQFANQCARTFFGDSADAVEKAFGFLMLSDIEHFRRHTDVAFDAALRAGWAALQAERLDILLHAISAALLSRRDAESADHALGRFIQMLYIRQVTDPIKIPAIQNWHFDSRSLRQAS